ncbi:hypothetical protein KC328_g31 [Hortaea werneckii]|nr:hypothetical protein KC328_g31 [Hortaea werneckii]
MAIDAGFRVLVIVATSVRPNKPVQSVAVRRGMPKITKSSSRHERWPANVVLRPFSFLSVYSLLPLACLALCSLFAIFDGLLFFLLSHSLLLRRALSCDFLFVPSPLFILPRPDGSFAYAGPERGKEKRECSFNWPEDLPGWHPPPATVRLLTTLASISIQTCILALLRLSTFLRASLRLTSPLDPDDIIPPSPNSTTLIQNAHSHSPES